MSDTEDILMDRVEDHQEMNLKRAEEGLSPEEVTPIEELRRRYEELEEVRHTGCECGDDEACLFVRQREELRALIGEIEPYLRDIPETLREKVRVALEGVK